MGKVVRFKTSPSIFGTGLISLDVVVSASPSEPSYQWAGGTCGNVLTILSFLGWKSFPIARLNSDTASIRVKKDMKSWGVQLDYAEQTPTTNTPIITQEILKNKNGLPTHRFHWKNCFNCGAWLPNYKAVKLDSIKLIKDRVESGNVFFFDRLSPGAIDLAKHFKKLGAIVFFEPSAKGNIEKLKEALEVADIVKYSKERFLSSLPNIKDHTSAFLEIQTLGGEGLKYRSHKSSSIGKRWKKLSSYSVGQIKDTCGCGDWTTAGIIYKLCGNGLKNFEGASEERVVSSLKYGQALGAWNCLFEGARGGMYRISSKSSFEKDIHKIMVEGIQKTKKYNKPPQKEIEGASSCPKCEAI